MHGSMWNDKSRRYKVLRPFALVKSVPKSRWTEDKYIEEAMELFKLEGKGKRLGKEFIFEECCHFFKEATKWKGGCGYGRDHSKLKLDALKYELHPMGAKAAKNEKHVANAQLACH
jgi:hypothetical protein